MSNDMTLISSFGQCVADFVGYEGNRHGATTKVCDGIGTLGYRFEMTQNDVAPQAGPDNFDPIIRPSPGMNIG